MSTENNILKTGSFLKEGQKRNSKLYSSMPNFTTEDLIQYLYKETSTDQTLAIEAALQSDWALQQKLDALKESMQGLDKLKKSPRQQSIDAILSYARSSAEVVQH